MARKKYLDRERKGTGGILFLICSAVLAACMVTTIAWTRDTNARSVAEATEHTIALYCLASCYTNNVPSATVADCGNDTSFKGIYRGSSTGDTVAKFYPLREFNDIMTKYGLMDATKGSAGQSKEFTYSYDKSARTFTIQFGRFAVYRNSLDGQVSWILPEKVQTVIEDD